VTKKTLVVAVAAAAAFSFAAELGARVEPAQSTRTFDSPARDRLEADQEAMASYRPSYPFWQHLFVVPDGSIAFGSERTGRLLVTFPAKGNWTRDAVWEDPALADVLAEVTLPANLDRRRDEVARLLQARVGPVVHNPTRGLFLQPNALRYGGFLREWATIYERFGVPAEIGLAQAVVESGFKGTVRSRARALGFCQWLQVNWNQLKRLAAPRVIEAYNQTTQAPYCAAYLAILATKYGSFIPALSEHHAGGTNVGRTLINGERLGGEDVREHYFLGGEFVRDLRSLAPRTFRDLYGTYGPRSALYAEMVFGNTTNVERIMTTTPQQDIYAMRTPKALTVAEISRATSLTADEIRRFNPALTRAVPARSDVYLPRYVSTFGPDVSFWHRPMSAAYAEVLGDFLKLEVPLAEWDSRAFDPVLIRFRDRFEATKTEEGSVMATTLTFVLQGQRTSRQGEILAEFRTSDRVLRLFDRGRTERDAYLAARLDTPRAE
jgi:Transglycosylase SLT domain